MSSRRDYRHDEEIPTLYVRQVHYSARPGDLRALFERIGPVRDVYIPLDYYTHESRGFAYVKFDDYRDAEEALRELNGASVLGRRIEVEWAEGQRKSKSEMRSKESYFAYRGRSNYREHSSHGRERHRSRRSRSPRYRSKSPRYRSRSPRRRSRSPRDRRRSRSRHHRSTSRSITDRTSKSRSRSVHRTRERSDPRSLSSRSSRERGKIKNGMKQRRENSIENQKPIRSSEVPYGKDKVDDANIDELEVRSEVDADLDDKQAVGSGKDSENDEVLDDVHSGVINASSAKHNGAKIKVIVEDE